MLIKPEFSGGTLILKNEFGGMVWATDDWPQELSIYDVLLCLCGPPEDGWYSHHEDDRRADRRWLAAFMRACIEVSGEEFGYLAASDLAELSGFSESILAAGSLVVRAFQTAFEASKDEAAALVRMNVFGKVEA
jgi:hypothetical protein